jgi:hypothetical protein
MAEIVALLRIFELDDLGAKIPEAHRAMRAGNDAAEVDDPDSVQGSALCRVLRHS